MQFSCVAFKAHSKRQQQQKQQTKKKERKTVNETSQRRVNIFLRCNAGFGLSFVQTCGGLLLRSPREYLALQLLLLLLAAREFRVGAVRSSRATLQQTNCAAKRVALRRAHLRRSQCGSWSCASRNSPTPQLAGRGARACLCRSAIAQATIVRATCVCRFSCQS